MRIDLSQLQPLRFSPVAREPRLDVPGGFSHVLAHGNRRATIFHDGADSRAVIIDGNETNSPHSFLSDEAIALGGSLRNAWTRLG